MVYLIETERKKENGLLVAILEKFEEVNQNNKQQNKNQKSSHEMVPNQHFIIIA